MRHARTTANHGRIPKRSNVYAQIASFKAASELLFFPDVVRALAPAVAAAFIDAAAAFDSVKKASAHICAPASINHSLALFDLMLTDRFVNDNVLDKGVANNIPETAFLFNSHPSSKVVESKGLAKNRGSHVAKPLNPRRPIILTAVFVYQVWVKNARSS
jgi:hypothetical protein